MARALASFTGPTAFPFQDPLVVEDAVSRGGILLTGSTFVRGQVVAYDTATSKWKPAASAAVCNGILAEDCDSSGGDAACVVYVAGTFMASGLTWPAFPHDQITEALRNYGINLESVEIQTGAMVKPVILSTERMRPDDTAITKDLKPKEIITATGPVPAASEPGEFVPVSMEPHAPEMRVQPGKDAPPPADEDEEGDKPKSHSTPNPRVETTVAPPKGPKGHGGGD
jgi:uncharacterized protein